MNSSVEFECKLDLRWSQIYSFVRWLLLDPRPDLAGIDFTTSISISSPAASVFAIHSLSQCDVLYKNVMRLPECDVPVPGIPGTENFSFFWWYRNRYQKKLVPEKSPGTGIGKNWYRKKVSEPVSEKFGTEADFCRQIF